MGSRARVPSLAPSPSLPFAGSWGTTGALLPAAVVPDGGRRGWGPAALEPLGSRRGNGYRQTGGKIHHLLHGWNLLGTSWGLLKTVWGQVLEEFFHQPTVSGSVPQLPWERARA